MSDIDKINWWNDLNFEADELGLSVEVSATQISIRRPCSPTFRAFNTVESASSYVQGISDTLRDMSDKAKGDI